jgi:Ser/Thr protein kinase RdoA (MazF antagonist)
VHALLGHLEARGFDAAPRALGFDERGREVLSYLPGRSGPASLEGLRSDAALVAVARLVRRYHDAVASFRPPPGAVWRFTVGAPRDGELICHNDLGPWNVIFDGTRPVGLIDWDFAAPAPRIWDVAYALWRWAPLYNDPAFDAPAIRGRRMRGFCDAYGMAERHELLAVVERRQRVRDDTLVAGGRAGVAGFAAMLRDGHAEGIRADIAYLREHRAALEAGMRA